MPTHKKALDLIGELSRTEQENLKMILLGLAPVKTLEIEEPLIEKEPCNGRGCPYCGKSHLVKNGHKADGTQRYRCKNCNRTCARTSGTVAYGIRKDFHVWQKYVECTMNGASIRKAASICDISTNTALKWRHKVLEVLQKRAMTHNVIEEEMWR